MGHRCVHHAGSVIEGYPQFVGDAARPIIKDATTFSPPVFEWLRNYLKTLTMELTTLARACGKQNVHHLEREDLAALTIEAAAMAQIPLAGTNWIPGVSKF